MLSWILWSIAAIYIISWLGYAIGFIFYVFLVAIEAIDYIFNAILRLFSFNRSVKTN